MRKYLPHVSIVVSCMFIVFLILDRFNDAMNFIDNGISHFLLVVLVVTAIVDAVIVISDERRRHR